MPSGDDDFDVHKYVLQLSKKIAQLTKDYVGLPFSNSAGQLPFSIDHRKAPQTKFYSTTRKWKRGDPLIGFYTASSGQKRMILNLPDGSTMLDLCYPGWEVAVIDDAALDHFFNKRYLFGDYYSHLLNGRPLHQSQGKTATPRTEKDQIETAMARQAELFQKRQVSVRQAIEDQQRRGVPFDAQPERDALGGEAVSPPIKDVSSILTKVTEKSEQGSPRKLQKIAVASQSVRENGIQRSRLVIQKTYSTGESETTERSHQSKGLGDQIDCDVEELLASQLFNVFVSSASTAGQADPEETDSDKRKSRD